MKQLKGEKIDPRVPVSPEIMKSRFPPAKYKGSFNEKPVKITVMVAIAQLPQMKQVTLFIIKIPAFYPFVTTIKEHIFLSHC